jgi:imidazolonepropionase-like amidohydrolase
MSRVADFNFYITDRLEDVPAKWTRFARTDPDMVKIFLLNSQRWAESSGSPPSEGLRPEVAKDIGDRATKSGLRASAHVESARDIEVAIAAGVDLLAHMPGYGLRADTKVDDYVVSDAAMKAAAAAGMSLTPTLAPVYADPNKSEEVAKITAWKREQVARWKAAGVPILYGSDNYFDLQSELRAMIDSKIWTGAELVEMLSVRTPRWILPGRAVGSLEPGSEAVFAVLRADPIADPSALLAVEAVYKDGVKIWPRDNKPANP